MDLELAGKTVAITGASAGIGLAVAEAFAREGADLLIASRDGERCRAVASEISSRCGVRAEAVAADFSTVAGCDTFVRTASNTFGAVDILINNAGAGSAEDVLTADDDRWQYYWDLHVMAAVRVSRGLAPGMIARGRGVILSTGSICATQPLYHEPIYNVTKAALTMYSKCLAHELISHGIRVNIIQPGLIRVPAWEQGFQQEADAQGMPVRDYLDEWSKQHASIGRFASAEELADFYLFLASPRAAYSVGSSYYVDGGWLRTVQ